MFIKIYFNDKPLILCDEIDTAIESWIHHDDAVFIDELNSHTVKTIVHEMQQAQVHAGVFYHKDLEKLKKELWKKFSPVKAAGGVVLNEKKEVLLIYRRNKWDLPKGKCEGNESLEKCALREVEEETGLQNITIINPLPFSYHTYTEGARLKLKETRWYLMNSSGSQTLVPQTGEDIEQVKWVKPGDLKKYLDRMFVSVRDVLSAVFPTA